MKQKLDNYFHITERCSSISTELIAGLTTFATMAYILAYMTSAMSAAPGVNITRSVLNGRTWEYFGEDDIVRYSDKYGRK